MKNILSLLAIFILVFGNAVAAECTPKDAEAADLNVDNLSSWSEVNNYFSHYQQCDDGDIAEGSSEAVIRLLVDKWDTLSELGKLTSGDPEFKKWMLKHINATLDTDDLFKVVKFASSKCPRANGPLCKEIATAAHDATTED